MYEAKILADSISDQGYRLTTFQITFPRFILAEVNTHRMLSRNSASSRAIPVSRSIKAIKEDPFIPESFLSNQKGMTAGDPIQDQEYAQDVWRESINAATDSALYFESMGVHKSIANRVLEPYKWHTAILSATDWENFFHLRCAPDAQPEFRTIAEMMRELYLNNDPQELRAGEWHLPMITPEEYDTIDPFEDLIKIAIGRCARVSYETHDGKRDPAADVALHDRLASTPPHLSPFEHVARPFTDDEWATIDTLQGMLSIMHPDDLWSDHVRRQLEYCNNFHGWVQRRATIPNEHDASLIA